MIPLRQLVKSSLKLNSTRSISSSSPLVDFTIDNEGICTLTMQRPKTNSLNVDLLQELSKSLDKVADNKCKGLVLTSAFPTVFSAGLDIFELYKPDCKRVTDLWKTMEDVWIKLYGSDFVTTAAVNGHAPAGGCLLAIACEYRSMVSGNFLIGLNETAVGIYVPEFLVENMGQLLSWRENELALIGSKMYTPEEGLKVGLIDEIATNKEDAIEQCKKFIRKYDNIPSFARIPTKNTIRGPTLRRMIENGQQRMAAMLAHVSSDRTQKHIESVIEKLKNKSKN